MHSPAHSNIGSKQATALYTGHTGVYLLVYPPRDKGASPRGHDLHWSIGWQVHNGCWSYVHLDLRTCGDNIGLRPQYCAYCGAQTQNADGAMRGPRACSLGRMSLAMRDRIQEIARGVPVCAVPGGMWTCQHWMMGVLWRMENEGIVSRRVLEDVVACAYHGACSGFAFAGIG
ncbi:hypothetical protein C8Q80DRAFT_1105176 [Daedaleopsis nitida]|nr:hypothetical protein C8Q80DRAFT_1105176 [Daedaleopsis nitida]